MDVDDDDDGEWQIMDVYRYIVHTVFIICLEIYLDCLDL